MALFVPGSPVQLDVLPCTTSLLSSVDRAFASGAKGRRFETVRRHQRTHRPSRPVRGGLFHGPRIHARTYLPGGRTMVGGAYRRVGIV